MSEKHRNLPPWMVKSDVQSSNEKDAKKKLKSVVTYWMNERELVETALSILKDDSTCARDAGRAPEEETTTTTMIIPETDEDSSDSDAQDRSRVSHIADQETVPYGNCVENSNVTSTKPVCRVDPARDGSGAEDKPDVDDEALELVRNIFFK